MKQFHNVVLTSIFIFSITAVPALADPFANIFDDTAYFSETDAANYDQKYSENNLDNHNLDNHTETTDVSAEYTGLNTTSENISPVINLPKGADIFDAAINAFTDVDTSSVDVMSAKAESQSQENAYNPEIIWENNAGFEHSKTKDRTELLTEKANNRIVTTSVSLKKTLWDKTLDYSIDSARNNIKTTEINQFGSQHELIESVALAYLDYLAAKDLVASAQRHNGLFLNLKNKINAKKESGDFDDVDVAEVESEFQEAQISLLEEKTNLKNAEIRLYQLTQNNNLHVNSRHSYFNAKNDISLSHESKLISVAMTNNTELQALLSGEVSLQKNILSKRAASSPKLDLISSISQEWSSGDTDQDTFDVSMGLNVEMPLYSGGRINNQVKLAKLELLKSERQINLKKREITTEISTLSNEFTGGLSTYKSLLKLHKQLKENVKLINAAVVSDDRDNIDVLSALDDEFEIKNSMIRQYYNLLKIKVEIMKITGDLDTANLNQLRALLLRKRV